MRVFTKVIFDTYHDTAKLRRILTQIDEAKTAERVEELLMAMRDEANYQMIKLREQIND